MFGTMALELGLSSKRVLNPYTDWALALPFADARKGSARHWDGTRFRTLQEMPDFSYVRSGMKGEIAGAGVEMFAAHQPGIVRGVGYWARGLVTGDHTHSLSPTWVARGSGSVVSTAPGQGLAGSDAVTINLGPGGSGAYTFCNAAVVAGNVKTIMVFVRGLGANIGKAVQVSASANGPSYEEGAIAQATLGADWKPVWASLTMASAHSSYRVNVTGAVTDSATQVEVCLPQGVSGPQSGPIIPTAGSAASAGADAMSLASPITADDDFVVLGTASMKVPAGTNQIIAQMDDGTSNQRVIIYRTTSGNARFDCTVAGKSAFGESLVSIAEDDRVALLLRRRGGKWTCAARVGTTITIGTESAITSFPVGMHTLRVGCNQNSLASANSPIEFIGARRGSFSDDEITNLLAAA